jgi:hypothetical protein
MFRMISFFLSGLFKQKLYMRFCSLPRVLQGQRLLHSLTIESEQYLMPSTNHGVPRYAAFSFSGCILSPPSNILLVTLFSDTLSLNVFPQSTRSTRRQRFGGDVPARVAKTFWLNKFHDKIKLHFPPTDEGRYSNCAVAYSL